MKKKKNEKSQISSKKRELSVHKTIRQETSNPVGLSRIFEEAKVVVKPLDAIQKECNSTFKMLGNGHSLHLKRLAQQCVVNVQRENLENLKNTWNKITEIKCNICGKIYTSAKKLQNHHENKHTIVTVKPQKRVSFSDHVIIHEVKDYHCCRKCTKIFEDYNTLKRHMRRKHKKRRCYICNYCNTEFMDRIIFKVHIKLHCDACGLLSPTRAKYLEHRRNVCKIIRRYTCRTCNETYFKYMDLKDHSFVHIGTYFVCDICKEQFLSFCSLSHHINFLHSELRSKSMFTTVVTDSQIMYQCSFCDETFKDKKSIEEHIEELPNLHDKVITGYKDYYFCDQCLAQFKTEKEMLQHKWSHYLRNENKNKNSKSDSPTFINVNNIPEHFLPRVVVERSKAIEDIIKMKSITDNSEDLLFENHSSVEIESIKDSSILRDSSSKQNNICEDRPLNGVSVGPQKKKIQRKIEFSKHQCLNCNKFFRTAYNVRRHINTVHLNYEDLRCKTCEEVFVWPSLLASHKCIRLHTSEMPFDDARPEVQIDNLYEVDNSFDDISMTEDYNVDFEIPDPIVNLTESESVYIPPIDNGEINSGEDRSVYVEPHQNIGYKIVLQQVPIEF